jgi:hypothetical protein
MQITRAEYQEKNVYIENAYKDVMSNLQDAMSKYNKFTTTGDIEYINGITAMLDEAVLAISDLAMAVNSELPDLSAVAELPDATFQTMMSGEDVPF